MEFENIRDKVEEHFSGKENCEITITEIINFLEETGLEEIQIKTWMEWAHIHYMSRGY